MRTLLFLCFIFLSFVVTKAQHQFVHQYEWSVFEDSLSHITQRVIHKKTEEGDNIKEDSMATKIVVHMLLQDQELKFDFHEDNLFIKALYNPERTFRVVTWFFLQAPGYLVYRGVIQFKNTKKLLPLFDETRFMEFLDNGRQIDDMNNPSRWYGAFYYEMIPYETFGKKKSNKYLLLGKKQSYILYDAKVVDVITVDGNQKVSFGDYFEVPRNNVMVPTSKRFVMLAKKNMGTILNFNAASRQIIFDVLDIDKEEEKNKLNNKMYLIPTGRYHAFVYEEGYGWKFKEQAFEQLRPSEFLRKKKKQQVDLKEKINQ